MTRSPSTPRRVQGGHRTEQRAHHEVVPDGLPVAVPAPSDQGAHAERASRTDIEFDQRCDLLALAAARDEDRPPRQPDSLRRHPATGAMRSTLSTDLIEPIPTGRLDHYDDQQWP
jgi:hypothetical protein